MLFKITKKNPTPEKKETSVLSQYRQITNAVAFCGRAVGVEFINPEFVMSWRTYCAITVVVMFFILTGYTIYMGVIVEGNWIVLIQSGCQAGAAAQGATKLVCCLVYRKYLLEIWVFLDATYEKYELQGPQYRQVLQYGLIVIRRCTKVFGLMVFIAWLGCMIFPAAYYILYDEKHMVMQFLLPGLRPDTFVGFSVLTFLHIICLTCGAFGIFAADMYFFVFILNAPVVKNILRCKVQVLDLKLGSDTNHEDVWEDIMDIVGWHKKYLRLLKCSERVFFIVIFVEIIGCCVSNLSIIYCLLIGVWPSGKAYGLFSVTSFFMYSALGTVVDSSNEDCCDVLYACRWYNLPIAEQKILLFMLRKAQSTGGLSVGKMMPLNMNTALQLSKATYSFLMILMNGREE